MLNKIIEFSVNNKLIIGLLTFGLIFFGIYQSTLLPIDAVPDITNNQVQVITMAPSYGALDIERQVTFTIEQGCSNISGIKEIRSFSRFGLSLVTIVFDDDIDIYWARQQVSEKLQQIKSLIPKNIGEPELGPISTGLGEIYQYVIKNKEGSQRKYDETELRTIQDWVIKRNLLSVKGVAEVSSFGGKLKQYEIAINTNKLNSYGLNIIDVFDALENNNENTGGTYIEKGPSILYIRSEGLLKSINDIENITIIKNNNIIFLRDVATIKIGSAIRYGALCYNDQGEVAGGIVMMLKGENSSQVIKNVKQKIEHIQSILPEGLEIEPFLDRTKMVNNAISTVKTNLLEGALIVIFILVIFLGNIRAGLIVASVIPLSMLFAVCMMNIFGVSGNLMSLGALDFGIIVDGAVIIVESIIHTIPSIKEKYQNKIEKNKSIDNMVISSSKKMMNSAVFGQIIILIVYFPIFTLKGIEGKMFKPMAQTVSFALIGAFILSLTYIPMISSISFRNEKIKENISDKIMKKINVMFSLLLIKVLRKSNKILISVFILFLVSIFLSLNLGGEFIPALEEGDFAVDTRVLTGSNLNTTITFTQKASKILKQEFPEIEKIITKIGSGEVPTDPMPIEASDMMLILKDKKEWVCAKTFPELEEKMKKVLENVVGITSGFQYPVQMRFNELMTGARQDVVCKIFGENLDTLTFYSQKIGDIISSIEGTENLYLEQIKGMPEIVIDYNRNLIAQYGLSISEINKIVNTSLSGQSTGLFFEDEKRFDIVVKLDNQEKSNIDNIKKLLIPTKKGEQIPLDHLADIKIENGINQIQREDTKRRIIIGFNINGRDVESIVNELEKKITTNIKFPSGYYIKYGGSFENLKEAKARLMFAVPISLVLIFILLYFAFKNIKQGILIYTAIPLSTIGGILFLNLRGMPFSISAGIGFIALFGVAVLNGIVLIAEFNRLKNSGVKSLSRIVIKGTNLRLRPVLMTALVASLGFLPMALSNGSGAEVQRPLATVVIGGLLIATMLTLFVLPILYIISEKKIKIKKNHTLIVMMILFFSLFNDIKAQTPITLDNAINEALKNNYNIRDKNLKVEYNKILSEMAYDLPKTDISTEFGQVNSALFDTKFSLLQNISFPMVYKRQKDIYDIESDKSIFSLKLEEFELKKSLTRTFYKLLSYKKRENLLLKLDSLFKNIYVKTSLRLKEGETDLLEKITSENQRHNINLQLKTLKKEQQLLIIEFQYLINSEIEYLPDYNYSLPKLNIDTIQNENHPQIQILYQEVKISELKTSLETFKLYPNFTIGINNNSFIGIGPDNKNYNSSNRFTSFLVGMSVPIFTKSFSNTKTLGKIEESISLNNLEKKKRNLKDEKKLLLIEYDNRLETVNYFENILLKNSEQISKMANQKFIDGELNYIEYVILLNQAITIETNYIDALNELNQTIIKLNYITI